MRENKKMEYSEEEVREKWNELMTIMARKHPALYLFSKYLDVIYIPEEGVQVLPFGVVVRFDAFVTGTTIVFTKDWMVEPDSEKFKTILHELWHVIEKHPIRGAELINQWKHKYQPVESLHVLINQAMDIKVDLYFLKRLGYNVSRSNLGFTEEEIEKCSVEELFLKLLQRAKNPCASCRSKPCKKMQLINSCSDKTDNNKDDGRDQQRKTAQQYDQQGNKTEECQQDSGSDNSSVKLPENCPLKSGIDIVPLIDVEELKKKIQHYVLNKGRLQKTNDPEDLKRQIDQAVINSFLSAKTAGATLSGIEESILEKLVKPKVDWRAILRRELKDWIGRNIVSTYIRQSRKIPRVLPGNKRLGLPRIWIFVDVSGSIGDEEFIQFMSEVFAIAGQGVDQIRLITWDTKVTGDWKLRNKNKIPKLKFRRGGGTTFSPIIQQYEREIKPSDLIIALTDAVWFDKDEAEEVLRSIASRKILVTTTDHAIDGFDVTIRIDVQQNN